MGGLKDNLQGETPFGSVSEMFDYALGVLNAELKKYQSELAQNSFLSGQLKKCQRIIERYENNPKYLGAKSSKMNYEVALLMRKYLKEQLMEETTPQKTKDKLTHKQQILLLKQIGFFELTILQKLTTLQKGKLVSHLLNRTEKDSLELIRGVMGKPNERYKLNTEDNTEKVNKLFSEVGLNEHLVK